MISRLLRFAAVLLSVFYAATSTAAGQEPEQKHQFYIEKQEARLALTLFAQQAEQQVLFPLNRVKDIEANRLVGAYTTEQGIDILLRDTGLEPVFSKNRVLTIVASKKAAPEESTMKFEKKKLSGMIAFLTAMFGGGQTAMAVENGNGDDSIEEIVVTASYAGSLASALDQKRMADGIVDSVKAEDIGKFPAVNIAEAVQRIPGVSITREAGEGQFVSVRGLGPTFQAVTFNGAPIAYNENIRNSGQSGRQFRFRILPADLISGVGVYKSPTADMIDGGIGSNIDVATQNPLDGDGFTSINVFANYDEQSEQSNPNAAISYGWNNEDKNFGFIGGLSRSEREVRFDRFQTEGFSTFTIDGQEVERAGNLQATLEQEKRQRTSAFGAMKWQPSDQLELGLDVLYSKFENEILEDRIRFEGDSGTSLAGSTIIENGLVVADSRVGGRVSRNLEASAQTHENLFVKLGGDWQINDDWNVSAFYSFSEADSKLDLPLQRIEARTVGGVDGNGNSVDYSYDLRGGVNSQSLPVFSTSVNLADPNAIPFRRYRIRPIESNDEDNSFLADIERQFEGVITGVKAGIQWTERSRDYQRRDRTLVGPDVDGSFYNRSIPNAYGDIFGSGALHQVGGNVGLFTGSFGLNPNDNALNNPTNSDRRNSYGVEEEILATYARFDFEAEASGVPIEGNFGLRYVTTDTDVLGNESVADGSGGTTIQPRTFSSSYSEVLPSINANFKFTDNVQMRLGLSRSMTRPSLADLRSTLTPNSTAVSDLADAAAQGQAAIDAAIVDLRNGGELVGIAGNPNLDPYLSWNLDASFEWYFDDFGALTIAAFYKDIDGFIASVVQDELLTVSGVQTSFAIQRPINAGKASVSGIELGYTTKWENGFGLTATGTVTDSSAELDLPTGQVTANLQGVSDLSYNISPFYEKGPIQARISYTWRSEFDRGFSLNTSSGRAFTVGAFGSLDFSLSYDINERFSVYVSGVNMLDEVETAYETNKAFIRELNDYGRSYNVGVRASF
ncbi:TonB-dependent receptor [Pseudoteredinibacter isoporae]|uniref:TonB-dependent receptor n=1 Tax=Pseudoteredinibacter isoporae TaxID=570281 RepID=UPI001C8813A3